MTRYGEMVNNVRAPQKEKARTDQVKNNAGGYVFEVGMWKQLDRFLILGQCGPTYYATERKAVKDNADVIRKCIAEDGIRVVNRIVEISDAGRAPKNDPAIFALAMAAGAQSPETRKAALQALPKVCRIGTHLFHFAADVQGFRKWGRGLRTAIASWYVDRKEDDLSMQAIKYQQRDGWAHRDLLRLSHPIAKNPKMDATFRWMVGGAEAVDSVKGREPSKQKLGKILDSVIDKIKQPKRGKEPVGSLRNFLPSIIAAHDELHAATELKDVVRLIQDNRLPRESVPTQWLKEPVVWEALLPHMGITALIRNLGKMTSIGLIKPMSDSTKAIVSTLTDENLIRKGRVHPMQFLLAQGIYRQGQGDKGKLTWKAERSIGDALDEGFYTAFKTLEPTGKNIMLALDVSGSMDSGLIAGAPGITPRVASAAMAMVTARVEKNWHMVGFTSTGTGYGGRWGGSASGLTTIDVSKTERLDALCRKVSAMPMGGTDCALPMVHALKEKLEVDVFQIYTDNETWHGAIHPFQALKEYRQKMGRDAKLIVVGMTATECSIADPNDGGMLDCVGFDSATPGIMASFARGEV